MGSTQAPSGGRGRPRDDRGRAGVAGLVAWLGGRWLAARLGGFALQWLRRGVVGSRQMMSYGFDINDGRFSCSQFLQLSLSHLMTALSLAHLRNRHWRKCVAILELRYLQLCGCLHHWVCFEKSDFTDLNISLSISFPLFPLHPSLPPRSLHDATVPVGSSIVAV